MFGHHGQFIEMQRAVKHPAGREADRRIPVIHHYEAQTLIDMGLEQLRRAGVVAIHFWVNRLPEQCARAVFDGWQ